MTDLHRWTENDGNILQSHLILLLLLHSNSQICERIAVTQTHESSPTHSTPLTILTMVWHTCLISVGWLQRYWEVIISTLLVVDSCIHQ